MKFTPGDLKITFVVMQIFHDRVIHITGVMQIDCHLLPSLLRNRIQPLFDTQVIRKYGRSVNRQSVIISA